MLASGSESLRLGEILDAGFLMIDISEIANLRSLFTTQYLESSIQDRDTKWSLRQTSTQNQVSSVNFQQSNSIQYPETSIQLAKPVTSIYHECSSNTTWAFVLEAVSKSFDDSILAIFAKSS
jgi:hypothetical protein